MQTTEQYYKNQRRKDLLKLSSHLIEVRTYKELKKYIEKFSEGYFDLMILHSRGGLGKSFLSTQLLQDKVCKVNSHITSLGLYQLAYKNKDKLLWLDDCDDIFLNNKVISILKAICETNKIKDVHYITSKDIKIPRSFKTKSKILLTLNNIYRLENQGILGLLDRSIIINFIPQKEEVINYIKSNFKNLDNEVIENIKHQRDFSIRTYILKKKLKEAGFGNWKDLCWSEI